MEQAHSLGLLNFNSPSIAAACVCFCELLGVCSMKLRVDLKALNLIDKLWSQDCEENSLASLRQSLGKTCTKYSDLTLTFTVQNIQPPKGLTNEPFFKELDYAFHDLIIN